MADLKEYSLEELYALYIVSDPPFEFGDFGAFGSEECLPYVGPEKPEGATDLPPYQVKSGEKNEKTKEKRENDGNGNNNWRNRKHQDQPKGKGKQQQQEKKKIVSIVQVEPEYANANLASWVTPKNPPKPAEPEVTPVSNAAPSNSDFPSLINNKPTNPKPHTYQHGKVEVQNDAPITGWGKPSAKPKAKPSFADLMAQETKSSSTVSKTSSAPKPSWNPENTASQPQVVQDSSEWPTLSALSKNKK